MKLKVFLSILISITALQAFAVEDDARVVDPSLKTMLEEKIEQKQVEDEKAKTDQAVEKAVVDTLGKEPVSVRSTPEEDQSVYVPLRDRSTLRKQEKPPFGPRKD